MSFIKIKDPRRREELIKDLIETRKRIKDNCIARKVGESEYQTGLTKLFKPVTETQKTTAKEITDTQKEAVQKITGELLPIREGLQNLTILPPIEAGEEAIPALEMTEEQLTKIGPIARKHLLPTFRQPATKADIKPGDNKGIFKIGETPIKIEDNNIFINDIGYEGTPGLWRLLTSKTIPDKTEYSPNDLYKYIRIMSITNTTRAKYKEDGQRISGTEKMNKLIKPLVIAFEECGEDIESILIDEIEEHFKEETDEEETDEDDDLQPSTSGTGLKILPSDPNALIDRFDLLFSSKKAGHTGVRNEIVSILDELKRQRVINTKEYKKLNSLIKK